MIPPVELAPLVHGGDLDTARRLFPGAREPFLDLSTGINPHPYPIPPLAPGIFACLPEPEALLRLAGIAAEAYGAPSPAHVVAAPGMQVLLALAAGLLPPGRAAILGPTYAEHARAATLAGHEITTVAELERLTDADLSIVVNPNNPDGRVVAKEALLAIAERLHRRGGLLMVDEAFMDVDPQAESLGDETGRDNIVVLRSFGKVFGLPGLRLSFALTPLNIAVRLGTALGPWPVSGAALAIGTVALADRAWLETARAALAQMAQRLDGILAGARLEIVGGTSLFRLIRTRDAAELFERLGRAGIFVRRFPEAPDRLRFGLPGAEPEWQRLEAALRDFADGIEQRTGDESSSPVGRAHTRGGPPAQSR